MQDLMNTDTSIKEKVQILKSLIALSEVRNLRKTFISAFETKSIAKADDRSYLHGSFNLGGTVSGRMSSNKPNLQNLPSTGTDYANAFKECFVAPKGWLLVGADFASLEDRIAALLTKDPNKLKVYTDLFDGHCLRAYSYFHKEMPDIRQIPEDSEVPVYNAKVGGTDICFLATDTINYAGKSYSGKEFYEFFTHKKL